MQGQARWSSVTAQSVFNQQTEFEMFCEFQLNLADGFRQK